MPLSILFDNRLDRLADALADRVAAPPGADPLASHPVIVPSLGVGRWLQQRIAARLGVCARVEPEFPGRLLWSWLRILMPELPARSPFDPAVVRWRLLALFERLPPDAAELALLRERLASAGSPQRLSIATEMAALFDRYLAWRRDWLDRWQRGEPAAAGGRGGEGASLGPHEAWQAWLWRALLATVPGLGERHPYDRFEALVRSDPHAVRAELAGRSISVFGMPGMSPAQFDMLGLLGEVADVAFFAPDPCRELWDDLVDRRRRARVMATHPEVAWLYDGEPAVLGDWGRGQRDFVAQVAALQDRFGVQASEPFRDLGDPDGLDEACEPDCLRALRRAVFLRSDAPWQRLGGRADDSIVVHAGHGAIRQAEILHDVLLDCFERLPGLHPSEVAVFCPDIEAAGAAIEAVFASVDDARRIPVSISGRPPRADPLLRAVLELPALAAEGPEPAAVEAWLLNPAVAEVTGLSADEVVRLMGLLDRAGACWGLDAADGADKHNWQEAIDRLLIGAAVGGDVRLVGELMPVGGLRGSRALLLEPLLRLFGSLRSLRDLSASSRPVPDWCRRFGAEVERLFGQTRRHEAALARLREALAELSEAAWQAPAVDIDAQAFRLALEGALRESAPAAIASGAVTVCPIGALRGVPFRVVCLFGMDEGAFPRRGMRAEADLMLRAPRFGDRQPRIEERGAFLDAVLAARDRFVVLFRGRDPRDDAALNPSPVVLELLAYLREKLGVDAAVPMRHRMPVRAAASAIVEHPLHPFAPRAFGGDGSFGREWQAAARALAAPLSARDAFAPALAVASAGPPLAEGERVPISFTLERLRSALADPVAFWLREGPGLSLLREERATEGVEPLWPDEARDRALLDTTARRLLAGEPPERLEAELRASPRTAAGAIGRRHAQGLLAQAAQLVERAGGTLVDLGFIDAEAPLDAARTVAARLPRPPADGRQRIVSGFRLSMHGLLEAWLRHLLLAPQLSQTVLVASDATATIQVADPAAGWRHVASALDRILAGPPAAFPKAWLAAWRDAGGREGDDARRLRKFESAIADGWVAGEISRQAQAVFWRDEVPDAARALADCDALWAPVLADIEIDGKLAR